MRAWKSVCLNAHKGAPSVMANVGLSWMPGHASSILVRYLWSSKEILQSIGDGVLASTPTRAFFAHGSSAGGGADAAFVLAPALARLTIAATCCNYCERQWHRDYAVAETAMES